MTGKLPRSNQREGKRILVVDDEPRMIGFIRMNLELEGHPCLLDRVDHERQWNCKLKGDVE